MADISDWTAIVGLAIGMTVGCIGGVWSLAWWLSGKFSELRSLVYTEGQKTRVDLTTKLEYHEKHDDSRFQQLTNELWAIKMRNAARDGLPVPPVYPPVKHELPKTEENSTVR